MEQIKISVDVNVNFSENTKSFITSLFGQSATPAATSAAAKPATSTAAPAATPAAKPVAPAAPATKPVAPAAPATKPEAEPAAINVSAEAPTIEDVRKALAAKVNNHRAEIKEKLNELGSSSVTKLDPEKYPEMLSFLNSLS